MLVEVWSDVVCPWCYLGKRRFEAARSRFEHAARLEVRWRSFELDLGAPPRRDRPMAEQVARKYGLTIGDAVTRLEALDAVAAAEGLDFDLQRTRGGSTFDAHRLLHLAASVDAGRAAALKEALLQAYFLELRPIGDHDVLSDVAISVGLEPAAVGEVLGSDRFGVEVRRDEAEAAELGCTGVPFFVVDRAWAVSGAQDADTFLAVLRRAWARKDRGPGTHGVADAAPEGPAGSCDDACAP